MDNSTNIAEKLSEQIQQELATEHTLSDVEKTTRRLVQEIGRRAIAIVVNSEKKSHPAPEIFCPGCGQAIPYECRRPAQLRTLEEAQETWVNQVKQTLWDGKIDEAITACLDLVRTQDRP